MLKELIHFIIRYKFLATSDDNTAFLFSQYMPQIENNVLKIQHLAFSGIVWSSLQCCVSTMFAGWMTNNIHCHFNCTD